MGKQVYILIFITLLYACTAGTVSTVGTNNITSEQTTGSESVVEEETTSEMEVGGINVGNPTNTDRVWMPDFESSVVLAKYDGDDTSDPLSQHPNLVALVKRLIVRSLEALTIADEELNSLKAFGDLMNAADVEPELGVIHSVDIESSKVIEKTNKWTLEYELMSDGYVRFYFRSKIDGLIYATYLVYQDQNYQPIKGVFAYADPVIEVTDKIRFYLLSFDFSDPTNNLLVMQSEKHPAPNYNYNFSLDIRFQCDTQQNRCTYQFSSIQAAPPTHEFRNTNFIRTSNFNTQEHCLAILTGAQELSSSSATFSIVGDLETEYSNVQQNVCTIDSTAWGTLNQGALPIRSGDVAFGQDTAAATWIDGLSTAGWDVFDSDAISDLISGVFRY